MKELGDAAARAAAAFRSLSEALWSTGLSTEERVRVGGRVMVRTKGAW